MIFENLGTLDDALSKKKGILIPTIHTGNIFRLACALSLHPNQYKVGLVVNMHNRVLFENLFSHPQFYNLKLIPAEDYSKIKPLLLDLLDDNYLIIIAYDNYGSQLRVPLIYDQYQMYQVAASQSPGGLHRLGRPHFPLHNE